MTTQEDSQSNPILNEMMNRRTVVLSGEISHDSINEVGRRLIELQIRSSDRINLMIDSSGGGLDEALTLCDLMTTLVTAPIRGIAMGRCGSAATFIMLHCDERVSTPYSQFLIHSGTRSKISIPINQTTSENLEHLLREVKATEELVLQLYMKRLTPATWTKKKHSAAERRQYVQKLIERGDQRFDKRLSAKEAVEVGLVTEIIREKLDIFSE